MTIRIINLSFFVITFASVVLGQRTSIENGWNGIRVFSNNRNDVEKILGIPIANDDKIYTVYSSKDARVAIVFSGVPCKRAVGGKGDFKLPEGTVIEYTVSLKSPVPLFEFDWKKDIYSSSIDPHRPNVKSYYNSREGVWLTTELIDGQEMLGRIWFLATDNQKRQYRCNL